MAMVKPEPAAAWLIVLVSAAVLGASGPSSQLAHISGSSRKIRMYMVNSFLQLLPDGTISGVPDDESPTTVLQRSSVSAGKVKIQGVTTCMYLCMDICGIPYASREFSDECVFNEMIEKHNYNTYSSAKYSNGNRTLYLGMTKKGEGRRVQVRSGTPLGRLSSITRVLTQTIDAAEGARHGRTVCLPTNGPRSFKPRCRYRFKKLRKRKKLIPTDDSQKRPLRRKCEEGDDCQRRLAVGRKRKSRLGLQQAQQQPRRLRHRKHRTAVRLKEEQEEDEDDDDVTMTTEEVDFLLDDPSDIFLDNNDNE